jgi:hypothetical protein
MDLIEEVVDAACDGSGCECDNAPGALLAGLQKAHQLGYDDIASLIKDLEEHLR